ncbi:hypothetical protein OG394_36120 [Kribbella sp. NBC_01245]|uniref:hypothetical protein n=1 Tax=Kribbella sp. NBC_01245 TaxID=2903578 RepID=UPI002E2C1560|nr:hypothetical protein [Kribbella sp. NBC_01245]
MNRSDEVDDLLRQAGAHWRAEQPSAPEPDLARITGTTRARGPRRWVPALAAASVAAIAAGALIVLPGNKPADPAAVPPNASASNGSNGSNASNGNNDLRVRDGDLVEAEGRVIAAPGQPVIFCAPFAEILIGKKPGDEAPSCPLGNRVVLTGLDVSKLTDLVKGVRFDSIRVTGLWLGGTIAVQQQLPIPGVTTEDPTQPDFLTDVPCAPPVGGWKPGTGEQFPTAMTSYVSSRPDQLAELWLGWPDGVPGGTGATAGNKPSVAVVEVVQGDVDQVRTDLAKVYRGNLCVARGKYSQTVSRSVQTQLDALVGDPSLGISSAGSVMGSRRAEIDLTVVTEKVWAALSKVGIDKLDLRPAVRRIR